jgi:hypothetical protein
MSDVREPTASDAAGVFEQLDTTPLSERAREALLDPILSAPSMGIGCPRRTNSLGCSTASLFEFSRMYCRKPIDHALVEVVPMVNEGPDATKLKLASRSPFIRLHERTPLGRRRGDWVLGHIRR